MALKFILLTGISGIGKSTIAQHIEKLITPIKRLGFGDLIYEVLQHEGLTAGRTHIRTTPDKFVSVESINKASELLLEKVGELRKTTNVLVETHAVNIDYFGAWIIPEISDFAAAKLDAIIVIHAPFEIIEERMIKGLEGRNRISKQAFENYQALQDAVAVNFSLAAKCPMYVVETDNNLEKTGAILLHIFKNLGMLFEAK